MARKTVPGGGRREFSILNFQLSIGVLMPWAMIAMAAVQAVGSIMKGVSEMQAQKQNALTAKAEGYQAVATAGAEADRTRYQVAAQQSALKAGAGAQGTTFAGSPMEVYAQNALQGEQMAQDKIFGGALTMQAKKLEARGYRRQATGALVGGIFGALGAAASAMGGGKAPSNVGGFSAGSATYSSGGSFPSGGFTGK